MTGGGKRRKDIDKGTARSDEFANRAIALQQPFADFGAPAIGQLSALSGLGTPEQSQAAQNAFQNSPFYTGGENAFNQEMDAVDSGLSGQGLLFSSARQIAKEEARQRNYQNAFAQFLNNTTNVGQFGANAANVQAGVLGQQGQTAFNQGLAKAGTRQGVLGTLGQISQIGSNIAGAFTGFG